MDSTASSAYYAYDLPADLAASTCVFYQRPMPLFDLGEPAEKRELTRLALEHAVWVARWRPPPAPAALRARHGFQDGPRLPCYRAVRRR